MFIIYKHTCIVNGKSYIGLTSNDMNVRWQQHVNNAVNGSRLLFHCAIRKFGVESWSHEVLKICDNIDDANKSEVQMIQEHNTHHLTKCGYNMTFGGDGTFGLRWNEASKQKLSMSKMGSPSKCRKIVAQIDDNDNVVAIYESGRFACMMCGGDSNTGGLLSCCLNRRKSWHGFRWTYVTSVVAIDNGSNLSSEQLQRMRQRDAGGFVKGSKPHNIKKVVCVDDNNEVIACYSSITEAANKFGAKNGANIVSCCKGDRKRAYGMRWRYV